MAKSGGKEKVEKPFDTTRDPAWAQAVDAWHWIPRDDETSAKEGLCPRCGHQISVLETTVIRAEMMMAGGVSEPAKKYAACNCGVKHPETPEGEAGCGANGLVNRA